MSKPIELKLEWERKDRITWRGYLSGHPETTLFLLSQANGKWDVKLRGAFVPDAREQDVMDLEQAKARAAKYMLDWIGMVAQEAARSGVNGSLTCNRPATEEIPNGRAKNPREGDLLVKTGFVCQVKSFGDGVIRCENAMPGSELTGRKSFSTDDWHRFVDLIMGNGARFIAIETNGNAATTADVAPNFKSCAIWPPSAKVTGHYSEDTLTTHAQAAAVCTMLQVQGLGGDGQFLPVMTWTEPAIELADAVVGAPTEANASGGTP